MKRIEALSRLQNGVDRLRKLGVAELYLYGSVARDRAGPSSDVDLLVEPANDLFNIFDLLSVQDACSDLLGAPAEVHDFGGYKRLADFSARVGNDLIRVF